MENHEIGKNPVLSLVFVVHAHLPHDVTDACVQQTLHCVYRPFLQIVTEFPGFHFSLHVSGSLLDRLERHAPDCLDAIAKLVAQNQMELVGGAYHEPFLPFIPYQDQLGQLKAHRRKLARLFGVTPTSCWIPERFWEHSLLHSLTASGYTTSLLDEHGFRQTGFTHAELCRPLLVEEHGHSMRIFPISKHLRYLLPFASVRECLDVLNGRSFQYPHSVWVYADDLEKFGAWPGTWQRVYQDGWLREFLRSLQERQPWIQTLTLADAARAFPARGPASLPTTAYPELLRWSLPPHERNDANLSGNPRHFLARYPEANLLHKRMLAASRTAHKGTARPTREILNHLWRSQAAHCYWYGRQGGIYQPQIRLQARAAASRAEYLALQRHGHIVPTISRRDYDCCGREEIVCSTTDQLLIIKPETGTVFCWEERANGFDRFAVMQPWPEENPAQSTITRPILPLEDLFFPTGNHRIDFQKGVFAGVPPSAGTPYQHQNLRTRGRIGCQLRGNILLHQESQVSDLEIRKTISLPDVGMGWQCSIHLTNRADGTREFTHGLRVPLVAAHPTADAPFSLRFAELGLAELDGTIIGEISGISHLCWFQNEVSTTEIRVSRPVTVWHFPLYTPIYVEGVAERIFQGVVVVFLVPLRLKAHEEIEYTLEFSGGCQNG